MEKATMQSLFFKFNEKLYYSKKRLLTKLRLMRQKIYQAESERHQQHDVVCRKDERSLERFHNHYRIINGVISIVIW